MYPKNLPPGQRKGPGGNASIFASHAERIIPRIGTVSGRCLDAGRDGSSLGLALEPLTINKAEAPRQPVDVPGKPLWCIPRMRCGEPIMDGWEALSGDQALCPPCAQATDSSSYSRMSSAMKLCLSFLFRCTLSLLFVLCLLQAPLPLQAREVIDMSGRKVRIPDTITKVVAVSPPGTYLIYALDPGLLAGINFPLWESEKKYTVPRYRNLPVIGGMAGQGRTLNREVLFQVKPDLILYWAWRDDATNRKFLSSMAPLPFPVVAVRMDTIADYPAALTFAGDLVGRMERGEELRRYAQQTVDDAKKIAAAIAEQEKVRVYYAEGSDGLSTERSQSIHAELISLAGGINVHHGEALDHYGMEKISMEQLFLYDPQVILVKEKAFFERIFNDPRWQNLQAVRDKQVYLIPYEPFNWFDRPPSFMRILGIKWLLNLLHPDRFPVDMVGETQFFYQLFLGVALTPTQAREVLHP
ncbi:ABC transporter substrate-binding protein [Desulfobulbus propionicus]